MTVLNILTLIISSLLLTACGGDSDGNTATGTGGNAGTSSITVTPSLGILTNATVRLYQSDGITLLASGDTGAGGAVSIPVPNYNGPLIVTVTGDIDAQYFDEASSTSIAIDETVLMRAIVPSGASGVAVTPLTEVAYQISLLNGIVLSDAVVNAINERVRAALAPELSSIITPPKLFDANTTNGSLIDSEADRYALRLAALASLGQGNAMPAVKMMRDLAADFADGTLDGQSNGNPITGLTYNPATIVADMKAGLANMAGMYADGALQSAAAVYKDIATSIDIASIGGTGGGGLTPAGDGAALGGGNGATGTVNGVAYTFTSSSYTPFPAGGGVVLVTDSSSVVDRWTINLGNAAVGTSTCDGSASPSVQLTASSGAVVYADIDSCVIEITYINTTEIEGRFAAVFTDAAGNSITVTDGYFRHRVSVGGGTGGLAAGEFGYSMDVDGSNVTVSGVPPLDGFDRITQGYLALGDAPTLQLRFIPEGAAPASYSCGTGSIAIWYFSPVTFVYYKTDGTTPGNCAISLTSTGSVYEGTFSGTLYDNNGNVLTITNGFFRNDGSQLVP